MSETLTHTRGARGEKNGRAKLTAAVVLQARALHREDPGTHTYAALARTYGVSRFVMRAAVVGNTWKLITDVREAETEDA